MFVRDMSDCMQGMAVGEVGGVELAPSPGPVRGDLSALGEPSQQMKRRGIRVGKRVRWESRAEVFAFLAFSQPFIVMIFF